MPAAPGAPRRDQRQHSHSGYSRPAPHDHRPYRPHTSTVPPNDVLYTLPRIVASPSRRNVTPYDAKAGRFDGAAVPVND